MNLKALLILTIPCAYAVPMFTITDLGPNLGPRSISSNGLVAGNIGVGRPFIWNAGSIATLDLGSMYVFGLAINSSGNMVGVNYPGLFHRGFLWNGVTVSEFGAPGLSSSANDISDTGYVTGANGDTAFLWNGSTLTDLGTLAGAPYSEGYAVNDAGHVAGILNGHADGRQRLFYWNGTSMQELNSLPGATSNFIHGLNNSGQIAGIVHGSDFAPHAVVWTGGVPQDIGQLYAYGINNSGWVAGTTPSFEASVWDGVTAHNLNNYLVNGAGWVLKDATGINDSGQITGAGLWNGELHGFLLTPVSDVPEPGSAPMMLTALAAAVALRKWRA